ncbi:thrombomodulin-like [Hippocampus comes]|uniref:thrombomodulin-like n=1 Tax=Hippocampus comes TaxID=109280 RepID=UPI00094ECB79|nr:PREDICTED: thrombomodulin-like [Hippocampus comes]
MIAFLTRALLLCGLQGTVLSLRGHCTDTQCYALFEGQKDFRGAQKSCRDSDGDLLLFLDAEAQGHLLAGLSGSFWFGTSRTVSGAPNCTSCTVWVGSNLTIETTPCGDKLAGYICQYPNADPCGAIPVEGDAKVTYAAPMGFEVNATSLHFPRGTVAEEGKAGAFHPVAKYLCFEASWLKAPWNCEVMEGGCDERCNSTSGSCECSVGTYLHANLITCSYDPCDRCAHLCDAATQECACHVGYALGPDGKKCADVDECKQLDVCASEGKECVNTHGDYECRCKDGFEEEEEEGEGACVDMRICDKCEHMNCVKSDGVYACACREGFRVSPLDPTKCEMSCDQQDCLANCIPNPDLEGKDMHQCFCPEGYVQDIRNNTAYCTDIDECANRKECEHTCENLFGSFVCHCNEGYKLFDEYMCIHPDEEGWRPADPTPAPPRPASLPTYVKAGSVLGITVFLLLCLLLLYLLVRNLAKRCGSLELSSLKGPDMDIFYLQQVTTETYKRLSFDKQSKWDSQRL